MKKVLFIIVLSFLYQEGIGQSQKDAVAALEFCKSEYQGNKAKTSEGVRFYVMKFMLAQKVLAQTSGDIKEELRMNLIKKQKEEFPKLRRLYEEILNKEFSATGSEVYGEGKGLIVNSPLFLTDQDARSLHYDADFAFMYKALNYSTIIYVSDHSSVHIIAELDRREDDFIERYLEF